MERDEYNIENFQKAFLSMIVAFLELMNIHFYNKITTIFNLTNQVY